MLVRGLTLTLFSSNSGYKQTTTLYIETKIEERERRDEREEKNEKASGRHVSPLPKNTFILSTEGRFIRKKLKLVCLCQVRGQGSKVNFK
jgi:hypothetical protein